MGFCEKCFTSLSNMCLDRMRYYTYMFIVTFDENFLYIRHRIYFTLYLTCRTFFKILMFILYGSVRILRPWDFPGKSTGVECHCLLRILSIKNPKESTRKLLELINAYSKFEGYKINTQESLAFL